ncbi:hypothetical protein ACJMK2_039293 [Sinanodonta woodiana]|uniref:Uncharacterized protein n=1 Tax=Sinanodonta woodiana TaxID=1069815 RepID=A0ABD3WD24_SINWO
MSGVQGFVGKWREECKDGFDEMANALGIPEEKKAFFKGAKTEIEYSQDGDQWVITVGMQGVPNVRTFRFKLGDSYDSESLDGSKMKSVMIADGEKFVEKHIDESLGAEMNITRWIEGGKMIVETLCGGMKMKSVYGRI